MGSSNGFNTRRADMKKTLLQLNSSIYADTGQSSRLAAELIASWRQSNPGSTTIVRDLAANPLPHLTLERFHAFVTKPDERTPAQRAIVAESDMLVEELQRADAAVL